MLLTIQHFVSTLSSLQLDVPLQPAASGIEAAYEFTTSIWLRYNYSTKSSTTVESATFIPEVLDLTTEKQELELHHGTNRSNGETEAQNKLGTSLRDIIRVFAGPDAASFSTESAHRRSAISRSGICIYSGSLRSPRGPPEMLRTFHVLPGHIVWGACVFTELLDPRNIKSSGNKRKHVNFIVSDQQQEESVSPTRRTCLKALLTENSTGGASFYYGISREEESEIFGAVKPMGYVAAILTAMGQVVCDQWSCQKELFMPCNFVQGGYDCTVNSLKIEYSSSVACCFWPKQDILEMNEILGNRCLDTGPSRILIRRNECQACCSEAAFRLAGKLLKPNMLGIIDDRAFRVYIVLYSLN